MYKAFSAGLLGLESGTLKDDAALAAQLGYGGIMIDVPAESDKDPAEIRAILEANKLQNGGFGLPVEFRQSEDAFRDDIKRLPKFAAFAQKIGADRCATWILPWHESLDYATNFEQHRSRLAEAAKILEQYGIRLGLEFVGPASARQGKAHEFVHDLDGMLALIDAIGTSNLGLLMDVFHWDMAGHTLEDMKKLPSKDWIVMAHINDAPAGVPASEQLDLVRALPGATGVLKIDDYFTGLLALGYDGPVYIEPFDQQLKAMERTDALRTATAAMDKVWPVKR